MTDTSPPASTPRPAGPAPPPRRAGTILGRLTRAVREQNWLAVGLELAIVVVGVFLGIQVSNWNQARADRALADRYVAQLADDLRADVRDVEAGVATSQWRVAAISALLDSAGVPRPASVRIPGRTVEIPDATPPHDLPPDLIQAAFYTRFLDTDRPAYTSLVNSGDARLVDGLPAFPCVQAYYAYQDEVLKFEERLLLFRTDLMRAQQDAGLSIAGGRPPAEVAARVRADEPLAAALGTYRVFSHFHVDVLERLRVRAEALLETLEAGGSECHEDDEDSL